MTERVYSYLESFARFLFFLLLILNLVNWITAVATELTIRVLPFEIDVADNQIITSNEDDILNGKILVAVDSIQVAELSAEEQKLNGKLRYDPFRNDLFGKTAKSKLAGELQEHLKDKNEVNVTYIIPGDEQLQQVTVNTERALKKSRFLILVDSFQNKLAINTSI